MYTVHLSMISSNVKTGPIPVSTTSKDCCPPTCPMYAAGCYAAYSFLGMHWKAVTAGKRGGTWQDFVAKVRYMPNGQLWRHNQAGDLPGDGTIIDAQAMTDLTDANQGKRGFTYTHYPMTPANRATVKAANDAGFTINLSGNHLAHADTLSDLAIGPVVTLLPEDADHTADIRTPAGRKVVVCPATYKDDVSCATCKLCAVTSRKAIVGFPAHGTGRKVVSIIAVAA